MKDYLLTFQNLNTDYSSFSWFETENEMDNFIKANNIDIIDAFNIKHSEDLTKEKKLINQNQYKAFDIKNPININLPVTYGDTVFIYPYGLDSKCIECKVTKITINKQGIYFKLWEKPHGKSYDCKLEDFDNWVFVEKQ